MTPLDRPLRRALDIGGISYVLIVSPHGLKLTLKGKRKGIELAWNDLVSGESALAVALQASIGQIEPKAARLGPDGPSFTQPGAHRSGSRLQAAGAA